MLVASVFVSWSLISAKELCYFSTSLSFFFSYSSFSLLTFGLSVFSVVVTAALAFSSFYLAAAYALALRAYSYFFFSSTVDCYFSFFKEASSSDFYFFSFSCIFWSAVARAAAYFFASSILSANLLALFFASFNLALDFYRTSSTDCNLFCCSGVISTFASPSILD